MDAPEVCTCDFAGPRIGAEPPERCPVHGEPPERPEPPPWKPEGEHEQLELELDPRWVGNFPEGF